MFGIIFMSMMTQRLKHGAWTWLVARLLLGVALMAAVSSPPSALAQGCFTVALDAGEMWIASSVGITNPSGYTFRQLSGESGTVRLERWSDPSWLLVVSVTSSLYTYAFAVDARLWNSESDFLVEIEVCPPVSPTETPTIAPTELLVTPTFTPVPTVAPEQVLVERADQSFQLQVFSLAVFLFLALVWLTTRH